MLQTLDFDTATEYFRESVQELTDQPASSKIPNLSTSYILPDFEIIEKIECNGLTILPSIRIDLPNSGNPTHHAFISKMEYPEWVEKHNNVEICQANITLITSSILALASGHRVESYFDFCNQINILNSIAIQHPILTSGFGTATQPIEDLIIITNRFKEIITILINLKKDDYLHLLRYCRLVQTSLITKNSEYSLGFSLLIAGIESVATKAIDSSNGKKHDKLFERFKSFINNKSKISKTNIPNKHEDLSNNPKLNKILNNFDQQYDSLNHFIHNNKKHPDFFKRLKELNIDFDKLIANTYDYRSKYFHAGISHENKSFTSERYVKILDRELYKISRNKLKEENLPNFHQIYEALFNDNIIFNDEIRKRESNKKFNKDRSYVFKLNKALKIENNYFKGHGRKIREILLKQTNNKEIVLTYQFMFELGRESVLDHFNDQRIERGEDRSEKRMKEDQK